MDSFEKISKMNLADLDSPKPQEEQTAEEEIRGEEIEVEETKEEPAGPKKMREPEGKHYFIDAEVTREELTSFLFGHTYRQPLVLLASILSVVWFVGSIIKQQSMVLPTICALMILVWLPFSTYLKGKNAKKLNPAYQSVFHYMIDEWGLHLELMEDAVDVEWRKVTKLLFMKKVAVLYTGKNNAFLIPSAAMGEKRQEIMGFIEEHCRKR
ncbi:MAG: hypothetical protein MR867_00200 [Eubacterium sp.]|nr:hypothetical protein [Eubacterium sp.]MDD7208615.1 hypothetical protein [Lachnospiraceae bacterium]MDY5497396.1 hypothetical protein [Anaerobutyricum sp.]